MLSVRTSKRCCGIVNALNIGQHADRYPASTIELSGWPVGTNKRDGRLRGLLTRRPFTPPWSSACCHICISSGDSLYRWQTSETVSNPPRTTLAMHALWQGYQRFRSVAGRSANVKRRPSGLTTLLSRQGFAIGFFPFTIKWTECTQLGVPSLILQAPRRSCVLTAKCKR
jgi:hypothetical protein